jgi:hypothetical protein
VNETYQYIRPQRGLGVTQNNGRSWVSGVQDADMEHDTQPHHHSAQVVECVKAWVVDIHGSSGLDIYP